MRIVLTGAAGSSAHISRIAYFAAATRYWE